MKTLLIISLLTLTGCGGYNVKDDGILGAAIGTTILYWGFGADRASTTGSSSAQTVNVNVTDWTVR
jgi:hypothetical protein